VSRRRFALLLIAALVVLTAGLYLASQRNPSQETLQVKLLPQLADEINAVTAITVRKGGALPTVTVQQHGAQWTVAERAEYPADVSKIRKLLLSLRDANIVEQKTSEPSKFPVIGVEDPVDPGAQGAQITVSGPGFKHALIVGKSVGEGNFVRRESDNRTFSVEPAIGIETEPRFWIDSRLLDVPVALLQSVDVKPAAGAAYSLHRLNPADNTYSLEGVPAGRTALDGHALAPSASTFGSLTADDVAPAGDVDFGQSSQAVVTLTDGNVMTLTGAVVGDKHWLQVRSNKDAALTEKTRGRAYQIASYRYDAIFRPLEQLLVAREPPAKPPAKTAPGKAGKPVPQAPARPPKSAPTAAAS